MKEKRRKKKKKVKNEDKSKIIKEEKEVRVNFIKKCVYKHLKKLRESTICRHVEESLHYEHAEQPNKTKKISKKKRARIKTARNFPKE